MLLAVALVTALAGVTRYAGGISPIIAFVFATLSLAGLAWIVSFATEQLGQRFGPGATGVMQSTLGNLPEFFVVIFALQAHQRTVAETAILGSILVNALLVLGLVIIAGALRTTDGVMRFSTRLPNDTATLLLMSSFIIILLGLSHSAGDAASHHAQTISIVGAIVLLIVYAVWLRQYLTSDRAPEADDEPARLSVRLSATLLFIAGGAGPSSRTGSSTACSRPSTNFTSPRRSPGSSSWPSRATRSRTSPASCSRTRASTVAVSVVKNSVAQIAAFLYPAARARLAADRDHVDLLPPPGLHRSAARDRGDRVADHRRRGGHGV